MTPLLKRRVDKALAIYYKCKKKPKIVVSGGKGSDEKISEAEAMANYLFSKGIARNQVILEKKSTNTYENLKFSKNTKSLVVLVFLLVLELFLI